jgi:thiol-disulfide isomerase/thioredoxin
MKYMQLAKKIALASIGIAMILVIGCGNQTNKEPNQSSSDSDSVSSAASEEQSTSNVSETALEEGSYLIKGKMKNDPEGLLVLSELTTTGITLIDSVRLEKGKFTLTGQISEPTLGFITIGGNKPPGIPVVLNPNEKIKLDITKAKSPSVEIKGSQENEDLIALYTQYTAYNQEGMDINDKYRKMDPADLTPEVRQQGQDEFSAWQRKGEKMIEDFINNHKGSAATYFAATFVLPETPPALVDLALNKLKKDAPELVFTKKLEDRLNSLAPLSIGGLAPDIALKNPLGKVVKLSSLRGKVVLIDFWASWCGPCRRENPNVVRMYQKYNSKGFEIYGVSLDNNKGRWQGAIKQDNLTWIHVSDLKGWNSSAAQAYKVNSIPYTVLLDKSGRIIAKNLRGASLEAKLEQLFN